MTQTAIVWFRQDLRLADQPALTEACQRAQQLLPLYIEEDAPDGILGRGSASRWWLHHSLADLKHRLAEVGLPLIIRRGDPLKVLTELAVELSAGLVVWNRRYTPGGIARDADIKAALKQAGVEVRTFNSALLFEPWEVVRREGEPYRVFTPFWNAVRARGIPSAPLPVPTCFPSAPPATQTLALEALELLPKIPWDRGFYQHWRVGELAAHDQLEGFLAAIASDYDESRNLPYTQGTSRLSPHLHFGEVSPRQLFHAVHLKTDAFGRGPACFLKELGWREFAYHLLYHFPNTSAHPLDGRFNAFPWVHPDPEVLRRWQRGLTGFPIIDAGMRELWHSGWMHNRVRMITASLLTKNLRVDWRTGADWFWDTLVDADLASNTLGWQWTAGCGADAAPFFRIFNPVLQGERFDPKGTYVRQWVPEIRGLPDRFIHSPWMASATDLDAWGVRLGVDYPLPLVDLKESRSLALAAFAEIKGARPMV